jgi:beta-phosphoglucomutase-like phosphatase (HAD superfamily)
MKIKAVLFDMDGTVLDTEPMYKRAWKSAFSQSEYEFSEELFNKCVGLPIHMTRKLINETYDNPSLFDTTFPVAASWAHNYKKMNGVPVKSGFYELSDFLKEQGIKRVIATSTSHHAAVDDLTCSNVIDHFLGIIGGDDVENGKPAPDPYIKAAELAGVPTEECLAIEDSTNGIRSAVSAGVRCVYIKDFLDVMPEIESMVYRRVTTLDEVIGIIKGIN